MKLVSIDLNTKQTGLIVWQHGAPTHRATLTARDMDSMIRAVSDALVHIAPEAVATEAAYLDHNAHTFGVLSQLLGALRGWCVVRGAALYILTTAEIDRATGVIGSRKHANAALARYELEKLSPDKRITEHESDAYCIGVAALGLIKTGEYAAGSAT